MQVQENSHEPQTKYGLSHTKLQAQLHNTEQNTLQMQTWIQIISGKQDYHSINS